MRQILIDIPESAMLAPKLAPESAAAELAGIPKTVFLSKLADYGVATFDLAGD